jgi:protein involved in polysaccharide export with SLBB domain
MGGDTLDIPQRTQSVSVLGKVVNPTSYVALKNETVEYYLEKAGGVTKDSEEDEIYVVRVDGSVFSKQQYSYVGSLFGHDFFNENLDSGDTIVVPERIEQTAWLRNIKDITTILGQIALSAGTVILGLR